MSMNQKAGNIAQHQSTVAVYKNGRLMGPVYLSQNLLLSVNQMLRNTLCFILFKNSNPSS